MSMTAAGFAPHQRSFTLALVSLVSPPFIHLDIDQSVKARFQ